MQNLKTFYQNTKNANPHTNVVKFLKMKNVLPGKAIDLGCGTGRDTLALIKNHWTVTAIDKENVEYYIISKLSSNEIDKFKFKKQLFEQIELEKNNLVVANYSLPFCQKNNFYSLWKKVKESILPNGYFIGNFFGPKDDWAKNSNSTLCFLTKSEVINLFQDFKIIDFQESEKDGKTGLGIPKHWHTYEVIAKKEG